jgi:hypothetical protein
LPFPQKEYSVFSLISSFYAFNIFYPNGNGGQGKNVFLFLEHILLPEKHRSSTKLPLAVDTFIADLNIN